MFYVITVWGDPEEELIHGISDVNHDSKHLLFDRIF